MALDVSGSACEIAEFTPRVRRPSHVVRVCKSTPAAHPASCDRDCGPGSDLVRRVVTPRVRMTPIMISPRWYSTTVGKKDEWHPRLENRLHTVIMGY